MTIQGLYDHFAISSYAKQLILSELHGKDAWHFNKEESTLTFDGSEPYRTQVLGLEDFTSKQWCWGWADTISDFPEHALEACLALRHLGSQQNLPDLTAETTPLKIHDGEFFAMIASGFCQAKAYYPCVIEGEGSLWLLIVDDRLSFNFGDLVTITNVILQAVGQCNIHNHYQAVVAYLKQCNLPTAAAEHAIDVLDEAEQPVLKFEFDELARLTRVSTSQK